MSSRSRLLLLSGPGGAGTSTLAAAAVADLADEGLRATLVDAADPADQESADLLAATLGRVLADMGADGLVREAWAALPGLSELTALRRAAAALSEPSIDVVVLDCGPLAQALRLVALPEVLVRLLDAAMTPTTAMWRDEVEPSVFTALSHARAEAHRLSAVLAHPRTSLRVVTTPEAADAAIAACVDVALLGTAVDGIAVTGVVRRKDDAKVADRHRRTMADLGAAVEPVLVWRAGRRHRAAPQGRSVSADLPRCPSIAPDLGVRATDDGFVAMVPLPSGATEVRVARHGEHLVIATDRATRWVPLPSVLTRCRVDAVRRREGGLVVECSPDPAVWPKAAS